MVLNVGFLTTMERGVAGKDKTQEGLLLPTQYDGSSSMFSEEEENDNLSDGEGVFVLQRIVP